MLLPHLNALQRFFTSHVLLYHSTYKHVPDSLKSGLHNVDPDALRAQVNWLKARFRIVPVDEFLADPRRGQVAITFDDGYECVFTEAAPVLDELQVPYTVFLNGGTLSGKPFWRDKIRFMMNHGLVRSFLDYYRRHAEDAALLSEANFYKMTKNPVINSRRLDGHIDAFLGGNGHRFTELSYCLHDPSVVRRSRYLSIGNHSMDHYVLSSLTDEEQAFEICRNHEVVSGLDLPTSRVFSIPFGGERDFNEQTIALIHDLGYRGFLYSRDLLNIGRRPSLRVHSTEVIAAERYMVPSTFADFHKRLFRLGLKSLKRRITG